MLENAKWIGKAAGCVAPWKTEERTDEAEEALAEKVSEDLGSTLYRKSFFIEQKPVKAELAICGLGYYDAYINGKRPDERRVLSPVPSDYFLTARYDVYDVTALIDAGENVLAAEICGGWFSPPKKWWLSWQMIWYASPRMIAELALTFEDGSIKKIVSDESWKYSDGPVIRSCIYDGEIYDFNRLDRKWNTAGFSDISWKNLTEVECVCNSLQRSSVPPVRVIKNLSPVKITQISDREYIYDFGENHAGQPMVTVRGAKGDSIKLDHAEFIGCNGNLDKTSENGIECADIYTLDGEIDVCNPRFTWHGYRYMKITVSAPSVEIINVSSNLIHSDIEITGDFICGDERLNELHRAYIRTQLACLQGYPVDCPQRNERKGWLGDGWATSELCFYNFDMRKLYASWLGDMRTGRIKETKQIQIICPDYSSKSTSIDWNLAYPVILSEYCKYYGDKKILLNHYETLKEHTEAYIGQCTDGFIPSCWFGDWFSVDREENTEKVAFCAGHEKHRQNPPFAATMFFCTLLRLSAEIAEILGYEEDKKRYLEIREKSVEALRKRCYDGKNHIFGSGGQFLLTYALYENLIHENDRNAVFENLVREFEKTDFHPVFGVIGTRLICDVFISFDRPELAYKLLTVKGYPGALEMISDGRTTLTEGLDGSGSGCHCMFASPDTAFYRILCGVSIDRTKNTPVTIRPFCPEDLSFAQCTLKISEGELKVKWERNGGRIRYEISVPQGIAADIELMNGSEKIKKSSFSGELKITMGE